MFNYFFCSYVHQDSVGLQKRTERLTQAQEKAAKMSQKPVQSEVKQQYHNDVKQINEQLLAVYKNPAMTATIQDFYS